MTFWFEICGDCRERKNIIYRKEGLLSEAPIKKQLQMKILHSKGLGGNEPNKQMRAIPEGLWNSYRVEKSWRQPRFEIGAVPNSNLTIIEK